MLFRSVNPVAVRTFAPRAMRGGVGGCLIEGRVAGKLPDGSSVAFEYTGDSCKITWSGRWLGYAADGGSLSVSLVEHWYDKTIDVYCIFNRPSRASNLSVRYKDAPPISLSPSLSGPPK